MGMHRLRVLGLSLAIASVVLMTAWGRADWPSPAVAASQTAVMAIGASLVLMLAIAIQNVPEGLAVSLAAPV